MPIPTFTTPPIINTGVTAGAYTNANITVNAKGQVTVAANGTAVTNNYNNIKIDQTPAGGTYGTLSGTVNGSTTVFTVSNAAYVSGTLMIFLNGQKQTQGSGKDWQETTPASGTFTFATAPPTGAIIIAVYITSTTTTGNIGRSLSTKTANYTIATTTDFYIRADATGGAFNVTLPTASAATGFEYIVKKIDNSANAVTVVGTIDGATNYSLATQYKYLRVVSNGTNWDTIGNN